MFVFNEGNKITYIRMNEYILLHDTSSFLSESLYNNEIDSAFSKKKKQKIIIKLNDHSFLIHAFSIKNS